MKKIFSTLLLAFGLTVLFSGDALAQNRTITIFLVRHAEKDSTDKTDTNPKLSAEGNQRAERLRKILAGFRPNRILSTDTERTRATVAPLARQRNLEVEFYDAKKLPELAAFLKGLKKNRKVVVVGHSNTTAALANLIFGTKTFNNLDESEYDKLFIIRLKKDKIWVEVRTF